MPRKSEVTHLTLTPEQSDKLQKWYGADAQLAIIKAEEFGLRQQIVSELATTTKLDGTENLEVGNGWVLKVQKVQNYKASNANHEMEAFLYALHQLDPALPVQLVKWVPEISTKVYKEIILPLLDRHPELKQLAAACIEVKPGAPQVELVPPKE